MNAALWIISGGIAVGLLYGLFGVGSAFATPLLSLLGVTGMAAVVGPLPALLPGSAAGAWSYSRRGKVDWPVARATLLGAVPAALLGAVTSRWVG
ncbi:MAG TPA: TSUP family transporter, partial [Acidimicrobiales bacterium]